MGSLKGILIHIHRDVIGRLTELHTKGVVRNIFTHRSCGGEEATTEIKVLSTCIYPSSQKCQHYDL